MIWQSDTPSSLNFSTILGPNPPHDLNNPLHNTSDDIFYLGQVLEIQILVMMIQVTIPFREYANGTESGQYYGYA